jgi:hypothetical protein
VYAVALLFSMTATDVWIFVRTDCPISNRYAPTVAKLQREFAPVRFQLVYPEPGATQESIDKHKREYGLGAIPAVLDAELMRVRKAGVRVTPEAVVFADDGALVYRGRIDDRQASLRVARAPQKQDLREVLRRLPARLVETRAIGCAIEGLR